MSRGPEGRRDKASPHLGTTDLSSEEKKSESMYETREESKIETVGMRQRKKNHKGVQTQGSHLDS